MSFRRTPRQAEEARNWQRFLRSNRDLLARAGVPSSLSESHALFDDLLMHGYLDHHPDPTRFSVDELNPEQRALLAEAVVRYLRAGCADPGLALFGDELDSEIRRRAQEP
jgi:hypothetical protein